MKPKVLILRTAGTNRDRETRFAFDFAGADAYIYHINFMKRAGNFSGYQIICIPGGFSYGDDLGAGKIFSRQLMLWFKDAITGFLSSGGLILGVCNGFQVLVKAGILPDVDFKQKVTLTNNDSLRFEDRWAYLKSAVYNQIVPAGRIWLRGLPEFIQLPVAHMEGKFYAADDVLKRIEERSQVVLRYVNREGNSAGYPDNPNGSCNDIAGITSGDGRILGLMPHPERFIFKHHHPCWHKEEVHPWGLDIIRNAVDYFK